MQSEIRRLQRWEARLLECEMAEPQGARSTKVQEEEDEDSDEDDEQTVEEDNDVHSDVESEELEKPAWVGYFRLPRNDVECGEPFLPNDK